MKHIINNIIDTVVSLTLLALPFPLIAFVWTFDLFYIKLEATLILVIAKGVIFHKLLNYKK